MKPCSCTATDVATAVGMTEATTEGAERFLSDAAARGLDVDVVERPAARSLEEAAGILGISPADIVKSLVVKHRDGSFLFALIPGDRQSMPSYVPWWVSISSHSRLQTLPWPPPAMNEAPLRRSAAPPLGPCTPTPRLPGVAFPWVPGHMDGARSWMRMHSQRPWAR